MIVCISTVETLVGVNEQGRADSVSGNDLYRYLPCHARRSLEVVLDHETEFFSH